MGIVDILFIPWSNPKTGELILNITLLLFLIALLPILYFLLNKKSKIKEQTFNMYLSYVGVSFASLILMELMFLPLAMLLSSLFLGALFDTKSAKGMCYREKHGLGFRVFELKDKKHNDTLTRYSKEELKKYLPNPILYCLLLYALPLLMASIFHFSGLGYLFWI